MAESAVRTGAAAGPAASGVIVRLPDLRAFCVEQDGEALGSAVDALCGSSTESVLAEEGLPVLAVLAPLARVWLAAAPAELVDGLLLVPVPGSSDVVWVDVGVGLGVGVGVVVVVGVGVALVLGGVEVGGGKMVGGDEFGLVPCVPQFGLLREPGDEDADLCADPDWLWALPGPTPELAPWLCPPACPEPVSELSGEMTCDTPSAM